MGELAAGIAHEIRNPLTTLKGFIQLLKQEHPSMSHSKLLLEELERIEGITNQLLSLAKPQAIQLMRTDLVMLLQNTIEILTPQAHLNNVLVKINLGEMDESLYILCEANQLKQAFINLLKNAIESMPNGGLVQLTLNKESNTHVRLTMQDQGCGIPQELLPRLGEPFYTLKEKGTGLGLMICYKIIKEHQGTILLESKVGEGTKVRIELPLLV
ncbi:ATP-binding protein [Ammoniphilus sp. YIM 78166]|uniref:ATP-binding protein n=1 Tax=Ammoniphilus sp. YIM 78166 TaxID=1644106 RepID=UPI00106FF6A6|nr:ATP-binding protein [Ammoniphilus sp. YIM 78166]